MLQKTGELALSFALPEAMEADLGRLLDSWHHQGRTRRLWSRDDDLWTGHGEGHWTGWLDIVERQRQNRELLLQAADDVLQGGFAHIVLLGMGGSSLAVEVIHNLCGSGDGYPELLILDSVDPARIRSVEQRIDIRSTLFIVASKSGSTLEPDILQRYFHARLVDTLGRQQAAACMVVITDPGSVLEQQARESDYRSIHYGVPGIGGRYSALSAFGMVPAAMTGVDVVRLLENAQLMVDACRPGSPSRHNPGVMLGCLLAVAAQHGHDKVTLLTSSAFAPFGSWLEQLLAESTGKQGAGLIPIDGEEPGAPAVYGQDRLFVCLGLGGSGDRRMNAVFAEFSTAGYPVVRIHTGERHDLGAEFFRWEFATAVAGAVLGVNPFDQPDVESSKAAASAAAAAYEVTGRMPGPALLAGNGELQLYADPANAKALHQCSTNDGGLFCCLLAHLERCRDGDYLALLAWFEDTESRRHALQAMRHLVRRKFRIATSVGFGPRYLHSTGQLFKGGPDSGIFLLISGADRDDLDVPGERWTFGTVKAAQFQGDHSVLAGLGRRVVRIHLGGDLDAGLQRLWRMIEAICAQDVEIQLDKGA